MKIIVLFLIGCVLLIPAIQSFGLMFNLIYVRKYSEYWASTIWSYSNFWLHLRRYEHKLVRVVDLLSLFFIWGYIPYLLGRIFAQVKKV